MRCGDGRRASPPAPQGDPAPSCPDAVTKVMEEIVSPPPRQRPKVPQRPSRGPHLAQGQEKMSGKSLEIPFATACVPHRRSSNELHRHFSLSAFATASPNGSSPTRCCSMRSSLANHNAPDRTHQALIGCMNRLCLSPLRLPNAPGRSEARTRRKPPFREKTPKTGAGITVPF